MGEKIRLSGEATWRADSGAELKSKILFQSSCFSLYTSLLRVSLGKQKTHTRAEVNRVSAAEQVLSKGERPPSNSYRRCGWL